MTEKVLAGTIWIFLRKNGEIAKDRELRRVLVKGFAQDITNMFAGVPAARLGGWVASW